jgi:ribonuclease HI
MINDITKILEDVETAIFADDTSIFRAGSNIKYSLTLIQKALKDIQKWTEAWGFRVSESKTVAVVFARKKINITDKLKYNGSNIPVADTVKFLGVHFTYNLNWRQHIEYIEKKCGSKLNLMRIVTGSKWGANSAALLKIYRTLIRPLLLYGSVAFNNAQPYTLKRLDQIQFKALKLAAGALSGTPLSDLLVHTGELSLALQRQNKLINLAIKISAIPNTGNKNMLIDHWANYYQKGSAVKQTLYQFTSDFKKTIEYLTIDDYHVAPSPPWNLREPVIDDSLHGEINKSLNPHPIVASALAKIDQDCSHLQIYTDASKTKAGVTAIGIYIKYIPLNAEICLNSRLNNKISIFKAELFGIYYALLITSAYNLPVPISLYSDSLSSIIAIQSRHSQTNQNILNNILQLVSDRPTDIKFTWIPSHVGIPGNEKADKLAVQGTTHAKIDIELPLEVAEVQDIAQQYIIDQFMDSCKSTKYSKNNLTEPIRDLKYSSKSRKDEIIINRLKLGVCNLNYYLFKKRGKHPTGLCDTCKSPETIEHYLLHCNNKLADQIKKWFEQRRQDPSLKDLLSDPEGVALILKYNKREL